MSENEKRTIKSRFILVKEGSVRETIVKLVSAFLLTTVCGAFITGYLSHLDKSRELEHRENEQKREIAQRIFEQKSTVFTEICEDIDARYYAAYRCISAYKAKESAEKQAELYTLYQDSVSRWNTHRMRNTGLLNVYFSDALAEKYDQVHRAFGDQLHDTIRTMQKNKYTSPDYDLSKASDEDKRKYETANRVLRNYYPKALDRLNSECTGFIQMACEEIEASE